MDDSRNSDRLIIGESVYQSKFNQAAQTFRAEYDKRPVFVKRRDEPMDREARVLKALSDPAFPRVIAYGRTNDGYQLVIEEKAGETLAEYLGLNHELNSRRLELRESKEIILKLSLAYTALRSAGFYYRDLNMNHILIDTSTSERPVALIDHEADVVIRPNGNATVDSVTGTWETMAPEEFDVGNTMTEASVTYGLGTVLYQLNHGEAAFRLTQSASEGTSSRSLSHALHMKPLASNRIRYMEKVLTRALDPDINKRYQTIEEFVKDVRDS